MDRYEDEKFAQFHKTFLSQFSQNCENIKKEIDKERNKILPKDRLPASVCVLLFYFFMPLCAVPVDKGVFFIVAAFCYIPLIPFIIFYISKNKEICKNAVQKYLAKDIFKAFGKISKSSLNITKKELINTNLYDDFITLKSGKIFGGEYKDNNFILSDLDMEDMKLEGSSGPVWAIKLQLNKPFTAPVAVHEKHKDLLIKPRVIIVRLLISCFIFLFMLAVYACAIYWIFYLLTEILHCRIDFMSCSLILLEIFLIIVIKLGSMAYMSAKEPENWASKYISIRTPLGTRFNLYAKNFDEARYVVSDEFLEKLCKIKAAFRAKDIKCAFSGNNLLITMSHKRKLFMVGGSYKKIHSPKITYQFYKQINSIYNSIYDLIDFLIFNKKIYLADND